MDPTWKEIIRDALVEIGAKSATEEIDENETNDAFRRLKGMLGQWGQKGLIVPGLTELKHTFLVSKGVYTLGEERDNPDIVLDSPVENINTMTYQQKDHDYPYTVRPTSYDVVSESHYYGLQYPTCFYYDRAYPLAKIHFDRLAVNGDTITLGYRGHFKNINNLDIDDTITPTVPPDYYEAIMLNLAVKIAPSYGIKDGRAQGLSNNTIMGAQSALKDIVGRNLKRVESPLDPALKTYRYGYLYPSGIRYYT